MTVSSSDYGWVMVDYPGRTRFRRQVGLLRARMDADGLSLCSPRFLHWVWRPLRVRWADVDRVYRLRNRGGRGVALAIETPELGPTGLMVWFPHGRDWPRISRVLDDAGILVEERHSLAYWTSDIFGGG